MRKRQSGVTFIGWLILLVPVAILVYAGIRATPIYLNYFRVSQALAQMASENKGEGSSSTTAEALRNALSRRFDVEYVEHPTVQEIQFKRDNGSWVVIADYEDVAPLFGNLSLLMQFHKEVQLQ